ncbi:MAG: lipocalin family protein [Bacteroidota bacterium]|nr:lipocalin family protein [Bacteroidota bacterium]
MKIYFISILALVFSIHSFSSCKSNDPRAPLLYGTWKSSLWLVENKDVGRDHKSYTIEFKENGNYIMNISGEKETGNYMIEGNKLFTRAKDKNRIMVKIINLTQDTLELEMNRSGDLEQLTFVR